MVQHRVGRDVVNRKPESCPPRHDYRKHAAPDGDNGHHHEERRRDGADDVGPDARAVHDAHEGGETFFCFFEIERERAVGVRQGEEERERRESGAREKKTEDK